jgi:hypothetical protein
MSQDRLALAGGRAAPAFSGSPRICPERAIRALPQLGHDTSK